MECRSRRKLDELNRFNALRDNFLKKNKIIICQTQQ